MGELSGLSLLVSLEGGAVLVRASIRGMPVAQARCARAFGCRQVRTLRLMGDFFDEVESDEITHGMYMEADVADEELLTAPGQELLRDLRHYVYIVCTGGGRACNFTLDANPRRYGM